LAFLTCYAITPLQLEQDGEIGPIKYVAEMIYGEGAEDKIDNAARILILFIIFAFDPLAVLLLVSSVGLINRKIIPDDDGNESIPASKIGTMDDVGQVGGMINKQLERNRKIKAKLFPRE